LGLLLDVEPWGAEKLQPEESLVCGSVLMSGLKQLTIVRVGIELEGA